MGLTVKTQTENKIALLRQVVRNINLILDRKELRDDFAITSALNIALDETLRLSATLEGLL